MAQDFARDLPDPADRAASSETLHFLPSTLDGLRVSGESGDMGWPVYLSAAQATGPLRVRIGYTAAVSVLPDASTIEVTMNGTRIGRDALDAPQGLRIVEFSIPPGVAMHGYNAITLHVSERHRVDCSISATYELWTHLEPSETGVVLPPAARTISELDDLPALLLREDGTLPIHILLSGKTNPAHLAHLIVATQQIALRAHALQPAVDFGARIADRFGVNLVLGTRDALGRIAQIAGALGGTGPLLRLLPATPDGRPTLIVSGTDAADVDAAVDMLSAGSTARGSVEGLAALAAYPGFRTDGDERLKLIDLGVASRAFSGRMLRSSFNLILPADFLPSDYARGTFDLAGAYAPGLERGAQVRVAVNGASSGVIKLPSADGDTFRHNQLFVPMSLMRPGLNHFDIIAATPRSEDAACAAPEGKRILVLGTSKLVLPRLARILRLPELAMTASGALPYTTGTPRLVVLKPDRDTMSAALSLTTRIGVAAGHVVPFTFATRESVGDETSTLVVAPASALGPDILREVGVDPRAVAAAWHGTSPADDEAGDGSAARTRWWLTKADGPAACRIPARIATAPVAGAATAPGAPAARPGADSDDLLEAWSSEQRSSAGWRARLTAFASSVGSFAQTAERAFRGRIESPRADGLGPSTSLILAQSLRGDKRALTLVTAPDAATLRVSMSCLFDPQVWSKVHGRLAVVDGSNGDVTATDAENIRYITSSSASLANSRLVLAAWFSLNPAAFVAVTLLAALVLSGTTLCFVRGVGRSPE